MQSFSKGCVRSTTYRSAKVLRAPRRKKQTKKQSPAPEAQSPAPESQSPAPDAQSPAPEAQSPAPDRPAQVERKRAPRPEPEVEEDAAPPTRKERMKEKVDCEHCGKRITKHAQLYAHAKNCEVQRQEADYEPSSPTTTIASYARASQPAGAQSAASSLSPGEDFMERLRKASLAYQQLDRQRHSSVIRNFYGY